MAHMQHPQPAIVRFELRLWESNGISTGRLIAGKVISSWQAKDKSGKEVDDLYECDSPQR